MAMAGVVGDEVGDGRAGADDLGRVPVQAAKNKSLSWTLCCALYCKPTMHTVQHCL